MSSKETLKLLLGSRSGCVRIPELLAECVPAIVVHMSTATIVGATPEADRLFGYVTGGLQGRCVHDLLPERMRGRHIEHFKDYIAHPRFRKMGPDGQVSPPPFLGTREFTGMRDGGEGSTGYNRAYPRVLEEQFCVVATFLETTPLAP